MILASIEFNKSINSKEFDKSYLLCQNSSANHRCCLIAQTLDHLV